MLERSFSKGLLGDGRGGRTGNLPCLKGRCERMLEGRQRWTDRKSAMMRRSFSMAWGTGAEVVQEIRHDRKVSAKES